MKKVGQGFSILILISLIVFVAQNLQAVELSFLGWRLEMTLALPILGAYFLGGLTARPILRLLNRQRRQKRLEHESRKAAEQALRAEAAKARVDSDKS